jgi:hypothetical protein
MKKFKKQIKEGLADNISNSLLYSFFIDAYPLVKKKGGLVTIMFPNVGLKKISRWVSEVENSDVFTQNEDKFKQIFMKMGANSSLKTLYRAVNTLKSKETNSQDNEQRISDLELLVNKIGRFIKSRLSQDERQLFESISSILDGAADNAAKSIEGSVGASTITPEKPKEEPTEEPTEEPKEEPTEEPKEEPTEKPKEEPTEEPKEEPSEEPKTKETPEKEVSKSPEGEDKSEEKPKEESVNLEEYLKSLIREIVQRKLKLK